METNGISLFDQQPEPNKNNSNRTAFLLGGLAALTIAGALGAGFVIGGRGGNGHSGGVEAAAVVARATRTLPISPTAAAPTRQSTQAGGGAPTSSGQNGGQQASNSGDTSGAGDVPAPTNTPTSAAPTNTSVPPTNTAVPPTNTPVPPTSTSTAVPPTNTPTATATPHIIPCPWCPIPPFIIDPPFLPLLDIFPPEFSGVDYVNCGTTHTVSFMVNESSEIWVTYNHNGSPEETVHGHGTGIGFDLGGGFFFDTYSNIELHAKDAAGNIATLYPAPEFCL